MPDILIRGEIGAAHKGAHAGAWRPPRKPIVADTSLSRAGQSQSKPRGGWLWNRALCVVMGHRRLLTTAAAEKVLPSGARRELFMCHACGSYAWKTAGKSYSSSWSEVAV